MRSVRDMYVPSAGADTRSADKEHIGWFAMYEHVRNLRLCERL
jgi:hypothetical protein